MPYVNDWPCRCQRCRGRKTLSKHPDLYVRPPKCQCGGLLRPDMHRKKKEHLNVCRCLGYWFPHRPGGGVWCEQHPTGPTEQHYQERYEP